MFVLEGSLVRANDVMDSGGRGEVQMQDKLKYTRSFLIYVRNLGNCSRTYLLLKHLKTPLKSKKSTQISADYSTVTDCLNKEVKDITKDINYSFNSLILDFTISIKTSNLTKTSHYTDYQQKLYNEVKRLKEIEGYGYRRISYILYEKGFRSIRTDSILKNNYIYSIYKKGKVREQRINRDFKTVIKDIMIYETR